MALEEEGFKIINIITWQKTNPPPNLACKTFTHSTEKILWARKDLPKIKYKFNYDLMKELNNNKQMKDVWTTSLTKPSEKKQGKHPISMNYWEFEKNLIQSIKSICKIYLNDTIFEKTYKSNMLDYSEILIGLTKKKRKNLKRGKNKLKKKSQN